MTKYHNNNRPRPLTDLTDPAWCLLFDLSGIDAGPEPGEPGVAYRHVNVP